jgi:hypothetical protein
MMLQREYKYHRLRLKERLAYHRQQQGWQLYRGFE